MTSKKRVFEKDECIEATDEPQAKKQRTSTTISAGKDQDITKRAGESGPFKNDKDNENYYSILNTLETIYWENSDNSKDVSHSQSFIVPASILKLIAQYSTGKILQCTECKNKTEVLIMNDESMYCNNTFNESSPAICCGDHCKEILFCCNKNSEYNQCGECGDYYCDDCIRRCVQDHACCKECLVWCAGCGDDDDAICHSCNQAYIDYGDYEGHGIKENGYCSNCR